MQFDFGSETPLFLQVAEQIESGILSGIFEEEAQIPSTTEVSVTFQVNPATVLKGMNILVDEGLLYKKRGIGMFVAEDAKEKIVGKRREAFYETYVVSLLGEARRLGIRKEQLFEMIDGGMTDAEQN
jgi:DNA-binding transcriptional regulator YhcF (GntR family)